MKICESGPVICRASGQASADTLNETCPCLTCDHEAPIVAGAYCMAGNFVDRNTNQNGCGVRENASFTLNTVDRHAVAYDARHHCLGGEVSGTLQAKGEGGWSLNYINPVLQPLPENTVGIDLYSGAVTGNTAATLTKKNDGTSSGPEVAQRKTPDWIVRRLIPMECGRLQGFPDGWAEIEPLTDLRELPFWREVYTKDCEIKGKKPNRKMMQADSEEGRRALMRWHDGLHSRAAEYAMWGNGMALPNALFFVKNAFRELGKPPGEIKLGSLFDGSGTMPLCAAMCGGHPVWASEVEPYPIAVTKTHLPNMKHLGSVTDIHGMIEWWQQNPAGGGRQREAYTMKIRSGCDGGGKGPLVQEELSATLATHQDQTLFELRNTVLNDQGGGFMEVTHGITGTLRAQENGHAPITFDKTEGNEKT